MHRIEIAAANNDSWNASFTTDNGQGYTTNNTSSGSTDTSLDLIKTGDYDPQTGNTTNWQIVSYDYNHHRHTTDINSNTDANGGSGGPTSWQETTDSDITTVGSGNSITHTDTYLDTYQSTDTNPSGSTTTTSAVHRQHHQRRHHRQ